VSGRLVRLLFAVVGVVVFVGGLVLLRPLGENWGATSTELVQPLAGDEMLPGARRTTMAVTIQVPAAEVWPWVAQMGAGRGGFYSYEWFENNLLGCQMTNASAILAEYQSVKPGDLVHLCAGGFSPPPWTVAAVQPSRALILGGKDPTATDWASTYQIVASPIDSGTTRLFWRTSVAAPSVFDEVLGPGFFVMQRRVLLGVQERAEGRVLPFIGRDVELLCWLVAFLGFVVAVLATAFHRHWQPAFIASFVATFATLAMVFGMPPTWLDLVGTVVVWVVVLWALFRRGERPTGAVRLA
jgi:hypothetical protein